MLILIIMTTIYVKTNIDVLAVFKSIFRSNQYDYASLFNLLNQLKGAGDIENKIRLSAISPDAKNYFIKIMHDLNMVYKNNNDLKTISIKRSFLKEVLNVINKDV